MVGERFIQKVLKDVNPVTGINQVLYNNELFSQEVVKGINDYSRHQFGERGLVVWNGGEGNLRG
jgi:hypothetical protein